MDINEVLDGTAQLDSSHTGGKFQQILEEELCQQSRYVLISALYIYIYLLCNDGFKCQMVSIVDAYILWQESLGDVGLDASPPLVEEELLQGKYSLKILNVFCMCIPLSFFLCLTRIYSYVFPGCRISRT
ncbi:hypothetical protein L208DRAFT_1336274 [Tricholoma matsutake]|nr:hypothetical protein L208DRAFT_1336274 [Tricholoma matsutake 945]